MNIDFTRWMMAKAGWKIVKDNDGDEYVYYTESRWCAIELIEDDPVLHPLLLWLAIDGVNRNYKTTILQLKDTIQTEVWVTEEKKICTEYDLWGTEPYSKESALKQVYELELLNGQGQDD